MGNKESGNKGSTKSPEDELFDSMFEFKQQAKEFKRQSNIAAKEEAKAKEKVKKAIERGDMDSARLFADEAIRSKNQIHQYLVMSSKLEIVASKLSDAYKKQNLTQTMINLTQKMGVAMKGMNLVEMTEGMKNFEKIFDDLEIKTQVMTSSLENITGATAQDQKSVDNLIKNVAAEHNLKIQDEFDISVKNPNAVYNQPNYNQNQNIQNKQMNQQLYN